DPRVHPKASPSHIAMFSAWHSTVAGKREVWKECCFILPTPLMLQHLRCGSPCCGGNRSSSPHPASWIVPLTGVCSRNKRLLLPFLPPRFLMHWFRNPLNALPASLRYGRVAMLFLPSLSSGCTNIVLRPWCAMLMG